MSEEEELDRIISSGHVLEEGAWARVLKDLRARGLLGPTMPSLAVPRGSYRLVRTDGTETTAAAEPVLRGVYRALGCKPRCARIISYDEDGDPVMMMEYDSNGAKNGKPLNPQATELARRVWDPDHYYPQIYGDVALINYADYGEE
jgi:hypothetical protein